MSGSGSLLDFVLGAGSNTSTTTNSGQTNLPSWMDDYMRGISRYAAANTPTTPDTYPNERLAQFDPNSSSYAELMKGFTPQQQQSQALVSQGVGSYKPGVDAATNMISGAGNASFPASAADYMSPYQSGVLDVIAQRGQRNLTENLLPSINDQFIGAGGYNGSRNQEFVNRALRDTNESIMQQQAQSLNTGYQNAATNFQADQTRALQAGTQLGAAAGLDQTYNLRDAAALSGVGSEIQGLGQKGTDIAYQDWLNQQNAPAQNIQTMNMALRGLPYSQDTSQVSTAPAAPASSPLTQLAGAGLSMYGMSKQGMFRRGGRVVRNFAVGGLGRPVGLDRPRMAGPSSRPEMTGLGGPSGGPPTMTRRGPLGHPAIQRRNYALGGAIPGQHHALMMQRGQYA